MSKNIDFKTNIWNDHCQVQLVNASKYYIVYYAIKNFYDILGGKALAFTKTNMKTQSQEI